MSALSTQVLIVDDHPLFRQALVLTLQSQADLEIVGAVGTAQEACELARQLPFDLAIVDVLLPTTSGFTLCSDLYELQPLCKVLILSAIDDPAVIASLLRAHACGFAFKTQPTSEIVDAIRFVLGGLRYVPPTASRAAIEAALAVPGARLLHLTRREHEVFELLIRGNTNNEIAANLLISRRTVGTHRQRVMNKLSAHTVVQMQRIAARHGLSA